MTTRVFQLGYPGPTGGANTEAYHTIRLWREAGWGVTLIPTWSCSREWRSKMDAFGVETIDAQPRQLVRVDGLHGATVLGMCNRAFIEELPSLKAIGCKTIWVPCMTCLMDREAVTYAEHGPPDWIVFQSEYQRSVLEPKYVGLGHDPSRSVVIHGAFFSDEFPFNPRKRDPDGDFVIGRLARPDGDKWNSGTIRVLRDVAHPRRKALLMGVTDATQQKIGRAPDWAEYLVPGAIQSREFLSRCHALLCYNGGAGENWPRVGLEAMASGVPVVAENRWGWPEMIDHGVSGYLANWQRELTDFLDSLASNERERLAIAEAARQRMIELADQAKLTASWEDLFQRAENGQ